SIAQFFNITKIQKQTKLFINIELTSTELMKAKLEDLIEMQQYITFEVYKETKEENQYTAIYDIQSEDQNDKIEKVNNNTVDRENYTVIKKPRITNIEVTKEDISEDLKFDIWEQLEVFLQNMEHEMDSALINIGCKTSKIQKRTFICEFGGKYKAKKDLITIQKGTQHNTKTKKLECL
ncbi:12604_t:CDS:2, partial [Cetraspora pellucida]